MNEFKRLLKAKQRVNEISLNNKALADARNSLSNAIHVVEEKEKKVSLTTTLISLIMKNCCIRICINSHTDSRPVDILGLLCEIIIIIVYSIPIFD